MEQHVSEPQLEVELVAITPDPEKVIEQAGRTCYLSFDRMEEDSEASFIRRLIKVGHESPLEHAYATFRVRTSWCVMAREQFRTRKVDEDRFAYVLPQTMPAEYVEDFHQDMKTIQQMYRKWRDRGLKKEDARFVLPNACVSEIVVSADFREWRHIFKLRLSAKAQWEIRKACTKMLAILKQHAPACFEDITADPT